MDFGSAFISINITHTLYAFAGIIALLSFIAWDMLWLRTLFMFALLINAIAGAMVGLYGVVLWDIAYCLVHLIQISLLVLERYPLFMPKELRQIYKKNFCSMNPGEFSKLWRLGEKKKARSSYLCHEGAEEDRLIFVYEGTLSVSKQNTQIATIGPNTFVGEMSFITGEKGSASVKANGAVEYISWGLDTLKRLKLFHPRIFNKLIGILGVDLVRKMQRQNTKIQELELGK